MQSPKGQALKRISSWLARFVGCLKGSFYDTQEPKEEASATDENRTVSETSEGETWQDKGEEIDVGIGVLLVSGALLGAGLGLSRIKVPFQGRKLFERIGEQENVDPDLLHGIAWQESNVNANAIGPPNRDKSRDWGMMQINERNFAALGLTQLTALNPERNVTAAAKLIQNIQSAGVKDNADILSIYNAGDARFKPFGSGPRLRNGKYVNQKYVTDSMWKVTLVKLANAVPPLRSVA